MTSPTLNRILHVEDEPDIQEIARVSLETVGGFTVATCSSGREALDRAEEFEPDLLLLDVMMPDMDGPTTLGELRKLPGFGSTPTIFMTAKVQAHEIEDALRSVAAARSMNDCRVAIGNLQALSHKMVGAAGTFGFAPISDAAREVEEFCSPLLEVVEPPGEEARRRIDSLVDALGRVVADGLAAQGGEKSERGSDV